MGKTTTTTTTRDDVVNAVRTGVMLRISNRTDVSKGTVASASASAIVKTHNDVTIREKDDGRYLMLYAPTPTTTTTHDTAAPVVQGGDDDFLMTTHDEGHGRTSPTPDNVVTLDNGDTLTLSSMTAAAFLATVARNDAADDAARRSDEAARARQTHGQTAQRGNVIMNPLWHVPYYCEDCGETNNPAPCYLKCVPCRKRLFASVRPTAAQQQQQQQSNDTRPVNVRLNVQPMNRSCCRRPASLPLDVSAPFNVPCPVVSPLDNPPGVRVITSGVNGRPNANGIGPDDYGPTRQGMSPDRVQQQKTCRDGVASASKHHGRKGRGDVNAHRIHWQANRRLARATHPRNRP